MLYSDSNPQIKSRINIYVGDLKTQQIKTNIFAQIKIPVQNRLKRKWDSNG